MISNDLINRWDSLGLVEFGMKIVGKVADRNLEAQTKVVGGWTVGKAQWTYSNVNNKLQPIPFPKVLANKDELYDELTLSVMTANRRGWRGARDKRLVYDKTRNAPFLTQSIKVKIDKGTGVISWSADGNVWEVYSKKGQRGAAGIASILEVFRNADGNEVKFVYHGIGGWALASQEVNYEGGNGW